MERETPERTQIRSFGTHIRSMGNKFAALGHKFAVGTQIRSFGTQEVGSKRPQIFAHSLTSKIWFFSLQKKKKKKATRMSLEQSAKKWVGCVIKKEFAEGVYTGKVTSVEKEVGTSFTFRATSLLFYTLEHTVSRLRHRPSQTVTRHVHTHRYPKTSLPRRLFRRRHGGFVLTTIEAVPRRTDERGRGECRGMDQRLGRVQGFENNV